MVPPEPVEPEPAKEPPPYSTWLLESLFTGKHRRLHPIASQVLGLLGLIVQALSTTAAASMISLSALQLPTRDTWIFTALVIALVSFVLSYVAVLFALQWIASCRFPLAIRLGMIYALIFGCLKIALAVNNDFDNQAVLFLAPLAGFGLLQHRRGWTALSWSQTPEKVRPLGIGNLMDLTAAIALTITMTQTSQFKAAGLACVIPASFVLTVVGAHVWGRLQSLCSAKSDRDNGTVLWYSGNGIASLVLFLAIATSSRERPVGLLALLMIPVLLLGIHYWTAAAIGWLRWCGWRFERFSER